MASSRKSAAIMTYLEPSVAQALDVYVAAEGTSASKYIRGLVIDDLRKRGLLTTAQLVKIAVK